MRDKANTLFYILGSFFIANALLAEFIGVKIFSFEKLLGIQPINLSFFGESNLSFNLTAGVLL
jgi:queuosine precursor transporter